MAAKNAEVISHWYHLTEGLQQSSQEFYAAVEQAVAGREMAKIKISRTALREGGALSAKREYLQVERKEHSFCICAAPFGSGFFVSWWLLESPASALARLLGSIPVIGLLAGLLVKPLTYYRVDTALMFQESVRLSVLEVLDGLTQAKGLRALSDAERAPILSRFFRK